MNRRKLVIGLVLAAATMLLPFEGALAGRGPARTTEVSRELKVRGQSRTLSMMLVLKNKKDKIDAVEPRKDYRNEIIKTKY